jgi:outer membrane protein assembly factor BamB
MDSRDYTFAPEDMNEKPTDFGYQLASRIAAVAGVVAIVVSALLLYDYSRRLTKDPLDSPLYKSLLAETDKNPTNESLKQQVRELDKQLRHEYFRQRAFTHIGAALLLVAVAVFLSAAKTAATLHRQKPSPSVMPVVQDRESTSTRAARWAVGGVSVALLGVAIALIAGLRSELPTTGDESTEGTKSPSTAPKEMAAPEPPPTEEEVAKAWPRFRGPGGLGISSYTNVPETWDGAAGKGVVWKTAVPLPGNNSPIVWGDRVFVSGADEHHREVYCFDAPSGKLLWQQAVPGSPQSAARVPKINDETGYAASTMATDGRRVFAIFANGDLAAFDFAGKPAWSHSFGLPDNSYGHASSLAMHKNLVLVQLDQGSSRTPKSKLLAFDSATGKIVWQVNRPVPNSWSSPIVIHHGDKYQIVTTAEPWVMAYDAADGTELWRVKCLATDIGPSPAFADGTVFVANDNAVMAAIRADSRGDATAGVLWKGEDGLPDTCSPLATAEFVFLLSSSGTLTCYDAVKGGVLWAEDFDDSFCASPSLVGKRLYLIGVKGKTWIVEPSREKCQRIAEADLGEECVASPAFQDGRIYVRGKTNLYGIGKP